MNSLNILDTNAFVGSWPFRFLGEAAAPDGVEAELRSAGIGSAWVSPLDAIFNAEPYTANDWLIKCASHTCFFEPVPIFNPVLKGAEQDLHGLLKSFSHIPAIRLIPSYHGYGLDDARVRDFLAAMPPEKKILLTLRVQDKRGQPPLFQVADTRIAEVVRVVEVFPDTTFLICGARLDEITQAGKPILEKKNIHFETSFIDGLGGIEKIVEAVGENRLHLGSLSPLLLASAAVSKIVKSSLKSDQVVRILAAKLR